MKLFAVRLPELIRWHSPPCITGTFAAYITTRKVPQFYVDHSAVLDRLVNA